MHLGKNSSVGQKDGQQNRTNPSSASSSCRCDHEEADVLWDVFRRQDIPKLKEYLNLHFREFTHTFGTVLKQVSHPIHDQTFYLSMDHKRKLKEEYGIEQWTFTQKSCISVCLDFFSPGSVNEAIRLTEEFRDLPKDHIAKEDRLEVKKLILHSLSSAIKDFEKSSKSDRDMHNEDSSLIRSLSKGEGGSTSPSPRRMNSISVVSDEVSLAPCKQENLTTPEIHPVGQPWGSPSPVSEAEIENKNVDIERVESALKKLQALSAAKRSHLPSSLKAGDASKNSSPLIIAKEIWDDFIKSPLKVFGNLSNEMTTMHAISMLIENLSLFDEKEAKLILDIKEILSSVVKERGMKEQLERKNKQELCELEKSIRDKRKRTGNEMEEGSARAEEVISVAEDKEAKTKSNEEKMAGADCVIDSLMSRFFAVQSQYVLRC
ncbi:histone modifying enzyme [Lithospermum erythrorhizon]|uniref:Histone modifying enzyme n=1 Tax=Lithospermum erythrorhizon TaxID=34254 RepID=A0AAV3P0X0_LITER